ncbi:MAG: TonB family protein [Nitrospirae bacterium]|nr:TonB family protein [Nitrospirota bacterium]
MTITIPISLLFHLLLLFALVSSNILYKPNTDRGYGPPPSAIHVNIVKIPRERPVERPPLLEKPEKKTEDVVKVEEVRKPAEKRPELVKPAAKEPAPKEVKKVEPVKIAEPAKTALPEPAVPAAKEKKEVKAAESSSTPVKSQKQEAVEQKADVGGKEMMVKPPVFPPADVKAANVQEARLTPALPVVSGPVVDIPDFQYDYYLGLIRSKVDNRWSQPVTYKQVKQTLVDFIIRRDGKIDNVGVAESSGDSYFDQTAVRAVSLSNPFPPLPRGYKEDFLKVRYRFIFGEKG